VEHEEKKLKEQVHKEHWFLECAKTTPIQYLPLTAVSAIRAVAYGDNEDKLGSIKQIIEIYEELLKEETD
jgi:hypothetical protein